MGPDFICIGAPRAGTSWLYRNISLHPDVWMPYGKEIHYFDGRLTPLPLIASSFDPQDIVMRRAAIIRMIHRRTWRNREAIKWHLRFLLYPRNDKWYMSLFSPGIGKITGDITPSYASMAADRVAKVHNLIPDAKCIYLLRNPITQMWSWTALRFRIWYRQGLENVSIERLKKYLNRKERSGFSSYLANLQNWTSFYPEHRIYVGFYDQLSQDPSRLFKDICSFLELDVSNSIVPKTVQVRRNTFDYPALPDQLAQHLARQYYDQIEKVHQRFSNTYTADWLEFAKQYL